MRRLTGTHHSLEEENRLKPRTVEDNDLQSKLHEVVKNIQQIFPSKNSLTPIRDLYILCIR